MPKSAPHHSVVAPILAIFVVLLISLAVGVNYGWISTATVAGLTVTGLSFLAGLALVAAISVYAFEETR